MLTHTEKSQERTSIPGHIMSSRGGEVLNVAFIENEEQPPKLVLEIEGEFGTIKVSKLEETNKKASEDINTLIARVLLMKQKRLTATAK